MYIYMCVFNYSEYITYDTGYTDGQYKKTADNSKLMGILGDFAFTPIEQGIQESVNWFIQNNHNCRK